jgi:hypothetical protein
MHFEVSQFLEGLLRTQRDLGDDFKGSTEALVQKAELTLKGFADSSVSFHAGK